MISQQKEICVKASLTAPTLLSISVTFTRRGWHKKRQKSVEKQGKEREGKKKAWREIENTYIITNNSVGRVLYRK